MPLAGHPPAASLVVPIYVVTNGSETRVVTTDYTIAEARARMANTLARSDPPFAVDERRAVVIPLCDSVPQRSA